MSALKWFKIRTGVLFTIYYILLFILLLFVYIITYSIVFPQKTDMDIHYSFTKQECEFEVCKLVPLKGIDNTDGVKVVLKGPSEKFTVDVFNGKEIIGVQEGTIYKGYEVKYTAYQDETLVSCYINNIFYLNQVSDNPLTYAQFQENVEAECLKKYTAKYNIEYRRNLMIFITICLLVMLLIFKLLYNNKCAKFIRSSTLKKEKLFYG